jgi:hypothetical protein
MSFKTKTIQGERYMICRASSPLDKYYNGHTCDQWCKVGKNATAILCYKCTMSLTEPPEYSGGYKTKGFPRGWQFMSEFVHTDGTVYFKGKEQPDLKGTKEPSQIETKSKPKLSRKEKQELKDQLLQQLVFTRGQLANAKLKRDINTSKSQLKKIERQLKKLN